MFVREILSTDRMSSIRPNDLLYLYEVTLAASTIPVLIRVQPNLATKGENGSENSGLTAESQARVKNVPGLSALTQSSLASVCPPLMVEVAQGMDYSTFAAGIEGRLRRAASSAADCNDDAQTQRWIPEVSQQNMTGGVLDCESPRLFVAALCSC